MVTVPVNDVKNPPLAGVTGETLASLSAVLDALQANVAVLDSRGTIVLTNVAWRQFSLAYSPLYGRTTPDSDVGVNYLEVSSRCPDPHDESVIAVQGIRDVLAGRMNAFSLTYPCHTPTDQVWFTMTVTPLIWQGKRGALVAHADTTPRHRLSRD